MVRQGPLGRRGGGDRRRVLILGSTGRSFARPGLSTILLDLDGTLVDPAPGIVGSFRHALDALGRPAEPADDLLWVIGPPIRETFAAVLGDQEGVENGVRLYRERYGAWGLFEAAVYDGVPTALSELRANGLNLLVCTSKAAVFARRVVDHFGLSDWLSGVYGPDLDGRFDDKGDLIAHILSVEGLASDQVLMVGDRKHDVLAAARHGIPSIGVLWGYGAEEELRAAGVGTLIAHPSELPAACLEPDAIGRNRSKG